MFDLRDRDRLDKASRVRDLPRRTARAGSKSGFSFWISRADTLGAMAKRQVQPCALAPLYVGQTAHTPEHHFDQHKAGGRLSASKAHKFGIRLRLDLMKGIGPFSSRNEAEAAEKAVAKALERRGHRVFWG